MSRNRSPTQLSAPRSGDFSQTLLTVTPSRSRTKRFNRERRNDLRERDCPQRRNSREERKCKRSVVSFLLRNKWRCVPTSLHALVDVSSSTARTLRRELLRVRSHERIPPTCAMRSSTDIDVLQRFPLFADQLISVPAEPRRQRAFAQVTLVKFDLC